MDICTPLITDPYTTILALWTSFQLLWLTLLVVMQHYQIARGITTHELSNLQKYGFLGGSGFTVEDRLQEGVSSRLPAISKPDTPHTGRFHKCLRILGVEQFATTFRNKRQRAQANRRGMNPFDQNSWVRNCSDFWAVPTHLNEDNQKAWLDNGLNVSGVGFNLGKGGEGKLGGEEVNYFEMWDVPERRRKSRRAEGQRYEEVPGQIGEDVV